MNTSASPAGPIRILIADDHEFVREGLIAVLSGRQNMQIVAQACNGKEAVELFREYHPEIVIMDLRMPQMDGLTATRAIVSEFPEARIIVLTNADDQEENSLRAGARAVVLKDAPGEVLLRIIRAEQPLSPTGVSPPPPF